MAPPHRPLRRIAAAWSLLLALLLAAQSWPAPAAAAMPTYRIERGASLPIDAGSDLALAGSTLIWLETLAYGLTQVTGIDLGANRRLPLPQTTAVSQIQPAISSTLATWIEVDPTTDRSTLVVYDLYAQQHIPVGGVGDHPDHPAIDGTTVVWREQRGEGRAILGYDLIDKTELVLADDGASRGPPSIKGSYVVWQEFRAGSWDIVAYDLADKRSWPVVAGPGDQVNPRVSDGRIVYEDRSEKGGPPALKVASVSGGEPLTLTSDHLIAAPAIDGNLVVWEDWRDGVAGIFGYDLDKKEELPIARSQQARRPLVDGAMVAWLNAGPLGTVVSTATLHSVLPTDRRDPPLKPDPNVLYFPETGQTLSFGFKSFWQQHGGLAVFGYPLTEEFQEVDPATGKARPVQYFERFKLVYNADEPDPAKQVQIARLGAEWLAGRELPQLPPIDDTANRRYFPETGHTLAYGFKEYWDTHDGLRLLGFPISEEMRESGRIVQYFERGRLEIDPTIENPDTRIMIGLLGRDILIARHWLPGAPPPTPSRLTPPR